MGRIEAKTVWRRTRLRIKPVPSMFSRLLALFVIVPAMELYLLIQIGQLIGGLETFGIIVITGLIGSYLAKSQGLSVWMKLQTKLSSGQIPGRELIDGVIILVSGALLLTPGVLTDVIGLFGLFPLSRACLRKYLTAKFSVGLSSGNIKFSAFTRSQGRQNFSSTDTSSNSGTDPEADVLVGGSPKRRPDHG